MYTSDTVRQTQADAMCKLTFRISLCRKRAGNGVCMSANVSLSLGLHVHTVAFARFRTAHMRGNPDVHSSQNSALFSTKCCTTIANHAPVISRDWWEHSLEGGKELAWEKGAGKGRADYFKDRMWAGGSKHADSTWCEIYSRILAAWQSRWKRDFSLLKDISEN